MRFYLTNECLQMRTVDAEVIRAIDCLPKEVLDFHRFPRVQIQHGGWLVRSTVYHFSFEYERRKGSRGVR
jgi:hypothetical protein